MPGVGAWSLWQMTQGAAQGPSAGETPVDQSAKCLRAGLSFPRGSVGSFLARLFPDSRTALTSTGVGFDGKRVA